MPRTLLATAAAALMVAMPAFAAPPPDARPASDILRAIEQRPDFGHVREFEWDEDGYWEVEYVTRDGSRVEIRVDPRSGEARQRR